MEVFDGSPGLGCLDDNAHVQVDYEEMDGEDQSAVNVEVPESEIDLSAIVAVRGENGERGRSGGRGGGVRALRGYNWTEQENLILIEQKRMEHGERYRRGAASEKFVHGKEAWRIVTDGCNAQVGFRGRDQNQVCNKWDALGKEFRRIRDYLGSSGAVEWWNLSKVDKKEVARTRKLPLEFTEAMYNALDSWHGQRIDAVEKDASSNPFGVVRRGGKGRDVVTGSPSPTSRTARPHERAVSSCPGNGVTTLSATAATPPTTVSTPSDGGTRGMMPCRGNAVPASSAATAVPPTPSSAPCEARTRSFNARTALSTEPNSPGDVTPSSAGRKRKALGTDSFERDSYHDHIVLGEAQEAEERAWRSSMLKLHGDHREASKDAQAATLEERLYELEVKQTARMERMYELEMQKQVNIGNMTNALLKMANSIENMTRVLLDKSR